MYDVLQAIPIVQEASVIFPLIKFCNNVPDSSCTLYLMLNTVEMPFVKSNTTAFIYIPAKIEAS